MLLEFALLASSAGTGVKLAVGSLRPEAI